MEGALIILLVTVAVGLVLFVYDRKYYAKTKGERGERGERGEKEERAEREKRGEREANSEKEESDEVHGGICCGRHLICEKSLSPMPGEVPEYYDDEELDRFAGRSQDDYSEVEIEEFRHILYTMLPADIPGWVRSLQLRRIAIPTPLRDEILLLLE